MNKYGIGLSFFLFLTSAQAEIYKWTDSNGTVHFSDVPHSGAQQVILPAQDTSSPAKGASPSANVPEKIIENQSQKIEKAVSISQPKAEETIRNNQGYIPVIVNVEPELAKEDLMQVLLDGQPIGKPQHTKLFALDNVLRGEHSIAVQLVDKDNNVITFSEAITVYMQRPRVGMVPQTRPKNNP